MRHILILFNAFILICSIHPTTIFAADRPELSPECIAKRLERDHEFNRKIMDDIISSSNLDIDESSYGELSFRDIGVANLIYGGRIDDTYYNSLIHHFYNLSSRGEPRLFVRPLNAYFLYKGIDNKNVMIRLRLENTKWVMVERKEKDGNAIEYKLLKCENDYLKKRNKYEH